MGEMTNPCIPQAVCCSSTYQRDHSQPMRQHLIRYRSGIHHEQHLVDGYASAFVRLRFDISTVVLASDVRHMVKTVSPLTDGRHICHDHPPHTVRITQLGPTKMKDPLVVCQTSNEDFGLIRRTEGDQDVA